MHKNNFDFLRLLFAAFVVITHSYALSGSQEEDWLAQLTNGQICFSFIGVRGFFIISGFLIYQSLQRSASLEDYFWKRILRLFPALFVVLLLTTLLGYFVYHNETISYWKNEAVWTYLPNNITLFHLQYGISGIFDTNPFPYQINASLWTIPFEFKFYILLAILFFNKNKKWNRILLGIGSIFLMIVNVLYGHRLGKTGLYVDLGPFFFGGAFLASLNFNKTIKHIDTYMLSGFLLLVLFTYSGYFNWVKFLLVPLILYIGICSTAFISSTGKRIGDLSYGIYIYSFPVQQTLMYFFHLNYLELMLYSFLITVIFAYSSWHLIEKKALSMKKCLPSIYFRNHIRWHILLFFIFVVYLLFHFLNDELKNSLLCYGMIYNWVCIGG